jgi:hypothetical protein
MKTGKAKRNSKNNKVNKDNKGNRLSTIGGWIFGTIFLVVGILNAFLVHIVPGVVYIIISLFYFPPLANFINKKFPFSIPFVIKLVFALVLLWATLAVGDLAEILGL